MKNTIFCVLAFAAASLTSSAMNVTYATAVNWNCNGVSGCGVSGNDLTINDLILRYIPNAGNTVNAPSAPGFTGANFGHLIALCAGGGDCSGLISISGVEITITVNQTVPFVQSTQFTGVLGGQISNTQSLSPASVVFNPLTTSVTDGSTATVNYFLQQPNFPTNGYILNSINDNSATSFQGAINTESIPEPSTIALIGLGLLAVSFRRRKTDVDPR
ncbi:MAG: PEP-CTERM sorting domain-containing protein [Acidobacteria bacterium]|nr:PEP-CTERM sorting domain-containing protein [Acidobacteriota bacterium]